MKKVKLLVFLVLSLCFSVFVAFAEEANAADMHRLYNPNSGEHFYTANGNEKNHLVKVGWKYEGIGWTAPATGNAVYRLYNANAGDHHYTQNVNEKNHLVKVGWKYEGIGWYSDVKKTIPLYRAYNPNAKAGSHNYTVNYAEQKNLIRVGWRDEGIAWYGIRKSTPVTKYTVTVKHVGSDGKTLKTSTASVEKGKSYTAKAGSFSGYTLKGSNSQTVTVNGNKTITFNYTKNVAPVTKYTVTVKHVGSDGKELKKTTATIEKGKNYTAKAETFSGYTLKGNNSQTVTVNGNKTITFNYTKNAAPVAKYTITVKYVDKATGKDIQPATTASIDKGKPYKIDAPAITDYTVVAADKTKSISSVSKDETLTINYTKNEMPPNRYRLTVKYVDDATGKELAKESAFSIAKGDSYEVEAVNVSGYTVKGSYTQKVTVNGDTTVTFKYTKNTTPALKYTITVKHLEESTGKELAQTTTVSVDKGHSYTADAAVVTGYTHIGDFSQTVVVDGNKTITFKYKLIEYAVRVKHEDIDGNLLEVDNYVFVKYGYSYTAKAKSIEDYTLADEPTKTVTIKGATFITFKYTKNPEYKITVKYIDKTSGKEIMKSTTDNIGKGKHFSVMAPQIDGYTVLPEDEVKSINSVSKDETVTIKYKKNPAVFKIIVKYKDSATEKEIKTETAHYIEEGKSFSITAPELLDYTVVPADKTKTIASVSKNETLTIKYTKNAVPVTKYKITVNYVDETGNTIKTTTSTDIEKGKPFSMTAPAIGGYTVLDSDKTKSIGSVTKNETVTFRYTKNKYTITVKYVDENGTSIQTETKKTVEHGEQFSMAAPTITGYTVKDADKNKSIPSVIKNETVTFNYTKNAVPVTKYKITVNYVDETGNSIKAATSTEIEKGKPFSMTAPAIGGYTVLDSDKTKSIVSVTKNETVTFRYTKNKYTITVKYVDGNGTSIKNATTQTVEHGKPFSMAAPTITGYTVVPADKTKSIDSVIKNETVTFKYTKDAIKYNVKVIHLGNDDKQLGIENFPVEAGTKYTAKSKVFDGYKLSGNSTKDVTVTADMEVTFIYNNLAFDVIKIDVIADGTYLKTVTKTVLPNEKIKVSNQILDLDPKEFDLGLTFYYDYTGIGGATRKYTINVSRFLVRYMPDSELPIMKKTILDRVNKLRQEVGVPLLQEDPQLSSVAAMRSGELKSRFSHTRPNNTSYSTAVDAVGITYVAIGENVARLPSQLTSGVAAGNEMFEMWEASAGHRKNMVDSSYQYIGIGLEVHGVTVYGTQLFIQK